MMSKMRSVAQLSRSNGKVMKFMRNISMASQRLQLQTSQAPEIIDVDFDSVMYDDGDSLPFSYRPTSEDATIQSTDIHGAPIAPVDVDGWADEDIANEGTVFEDVTKKLECPPIPDKLANVYKFQGIKVVLPKRMVKPQTYRYRLDKEDQETLADNMRVIKFSKAPNLPRPDILEN